MDKNQSFIFNSATFDPGFQGKNDLSAWRINRSFSCFDQKMKVARNLLGQMNEELEGRLGKLNPAFPFFPRTLSRSR